MQLAIYGASYNAFRRRLIIGFCLLIFLLILSLCWKIRSSYEADRKTAKVQTKNLVQAMSAHVIGAVQFIDLSLASSAEAIKALGDVPDSREAITRLLLTSGHMSDANFWVIFIDAQGNGVAASNNLKIDGVSYADRPYFSAHIHGPDDALFIGAPEIGRVSKRRLFFVSRRVTSTSGRFLGVVAAPVDASAFATVFTNALFQSSLSITLAHTDGKIIARAPKFEESFAAPISGSRLFSEISRAPSGTYEAQSVVDGDKRVYSYQSIGRMPLVISVGMASDSWTEGLIDDLEVATIGIIVIVAVLFFSGHFALLSYRRLAISESDQRRLNEELEAMKEGLASSEKRTRMITDNLPALVAYIDSEERHVFCNSSHRHIKEIDLNNMLGRTVCEVYGAEYYEMLRDKIQLAMTGKRVSFERSMKREGVEGHFKFDLTPDFDAAGKVVGLYSMVTDVSSMKRVQDELARLARVDMLTGLPNRNFLYDRLAEGIARSRRSGEKIGCLFLDLHGFKEINDTLGHAGGDELLKQFGARLQACVREVDMVARLAGDEFVIVVEGLRESEEAGRIAEKIIRTMEVPFALGQGSRLVTTSVGVAVADGQQDDSDSLLRKADEALYQAKNHGRNVYKIYEPARETIIKLVR